MIIIVECGRAGQVLVLDGRTAAMGGRGVVCARKPAVLAKIASLFWELVHATEPVLPVKVIFLLAFFRLTATLTPIRTEAVNPSLTCAAFVLLFWSFLTLNGHCSVRSQYQGTFDGGIGIYIKFSIRMVEKILTNNRF